MLILRVEGLGEKHFEILRKNNAFFKVQNLDFRIIIFHYRYPNEVR
jgi:hypothetical protein